jgi:NADH:ubiquinone oxidoreductase subunit 5 (subunit L)/multisubunit Na+/H+ antiporter MnhA subunit
MASWPILSVVTFLPIVGAIFIAFLNDDESGVRNARWIALWTTFGHLRRFADPGLALRSGSADFQFLEKRPWLGGATTYSMGVDGISLPFVILTTALMPIAILASWTRCRRVRSYMIFLLVLEILMVGTFCALDLVLFYLFFEGGLIPMFLIIGVGQAAPRLCELQVLLYTLLGSVLMLLAIMAMGLAGRHHRHPDAAPSRLPARAADLSLVCLPRLVRGEDADVAGAHLVARRARRGADGRLGDPGGDPAQARRLWLPALFAADVPASAGRFRALDLRAVRGGDRLHLAGRADAGG